MKSLVPKKQKFLKAAEMADNSEAAAKLAKENPSYIGYISLIVTMAAHNPNDVYVDKGGKSQCLSLYFNGNIPKCEQFPEGLEVKSCFPNGAEVDKLKLNETIIAQISSTYGGHWENWVGKEILLVVERNVDSPQGRVDAIRVRPNYNPTEYRKNLIAKLDATMFNEEFSNIARANPEDFKPYFYLNDILAAKERQKKRQADAAECEGKTPEEKATILQQRLEQQQLEDEQAKKIAAAKFDPETGEQLLPEETANPAMEGTAKEPQKEAENKDEVVDKSASNANAKPAKEETKKEKDKKDGKK